MSEPGDTEYMHCLLFYISDCLNIRQAHQVRSKSTIEKPINLKYLEQ